MRWRPNPLLRPVSALQATIDRVVLRSMEILRAALGDAVELHHIGSTSLPPLLTTGTVDILILGAMEEMPLYRSMVATLNELNSQALPLRIEFGDKHKPSDSLRIRRILAMSPIDLGEFLALQKRFEHVAGDEYPRAKREFFESLLASTPTESASALAIAQHEEIPHTIEIRTKRLVMSSALSIHAEEYAQYIRDNRNSHERFRLGDPKHLEATTWRRFFADEVIKRYRKEQLTLLVRTKEEDSLIGACHFFDFVWGRYQRCAVGYNLAERVEGNGYMTEALASAVHYMGETWGLHRVEAYYDPENTKSGAVLERVGFRVEGRAASYINVRGEWRDCIRAALHW